MGSDLEVPLGLDDHLIIVRRRVDGRDLARAEGVVERVADLIGRHAENARAIAVDLDGALRVAQLQVDVHVAQDRDLAQLLEERRREPEKLVQVGARHDILIERLRRAPAGEVEILHRLGDEGHAGHRSARLAQARHHLEYAITLGARLERDEEEALVDGR